MSKLISQNVEKAHGHDNINLWMMKIFYVSVSRPLAIKSSKPVRSRENFPRLGKNKP